MIKCCSCLSLRSRAMCGASILSSTSGVHSCVRSAPRHGELLNIVTDGGSTTQTQPFDATARTTLPLSPSLSSFADRTWSFVREVAFDGSLRDGSRVASQSRYWQGCSRELPVAEEEWRGAGGSSCESYPGCANEVRAPRGGSAQALGRRPVEDRGRRAHHVEIALPHGETAARRSRCRACPCARWPQGAACCGSCARWPQGAACCGSSRGAGAFCRRRCFGCTEHRGAARHPRVRHAWGSAFCSLGEARCGIVGRPPAAGAARSVGRRCGSASGAVRGGAAISRAPALPRKGWARRRGNPKGAPRVTPPQGPRGKGSAEPRRASSVGGARGLDRPCGGSPREARG